MKYFKKLVGDRIYLAPKGSTEEEIEKFTEWMNDFQVTDYTGRTSQITTYDEEKRYLEDATRDASNRSFNIVEIETDKLIGTVGLEHFNWIERSAVLGIFIGEKDFRSNGYGTEAFCIRNRYIFNEMKLRRIENGYFKDNEKSHKMQLKLGYRDEGIRRKKFICMATNEYVDECITGLLKEEFIDIYK